MMKFFVTVFPLLLITGCTSAPSIDRKLPQKNNVFIESSAAPVSLEQAAPNKTQTKVVDDSPCRFIPGYKHSNGNYVRFSYECPENSIYATDNINSCSWVASYMRSDGTSVDGHHRCDYNIRPSKYNLVSPPQSNAPCVGSYCGPVQVKGYYRKDGTYVRPHTRSRRK